MARSLRRQLERLHAASSACFWCKEPTRLLSVRALQALWCKPLPADMATVDHLFSKMSDHRWNQQLGKSSHVLACRGCNLRRSREELKDKIDVQRYKSSIGKQLH